MISTTNFVGSDGVDLGSKLLEKEYFNGVYLNIANQYITPELWCWGFGIDSHLGTKEDNANGTKSTPVTTFAGGANWKQVSAGQNSTAAIKTDGTLWVWGENLNAFLGTNTTVMQCTPVTTFAGGTNWKQVDCGPYHTAAIKTDGTLWIWGGNDGGRLGINNTNSTLNICTPVTTFAGGTNWKQVSCGPVNTAAIKTDGTLWVWGRNTNGQLGINSTDDKSTPVTTFAGGNDWKQVSLGTGNSAAVKIDGSLWLWGSNSYGVLGTNDTITRSTPVTTLSGGNDWKQVSLSSEHGAAIKTDGTLWVWGRNTNGQLGLNNITAPSTPVTTFAGGNNWKQVDCGYRSTIAIKTDGSLWTWGRNQYGQLGTNDVSNRSTPVTSFAGGNNWRYVSCRHQHAFAIRSYED